MNINFLVDDLRASQVAFTLIEAANQIVDQNLASVLIFYNQLQTPCLKCNTPTLHSVESWAQPGIFISTSLKTAQQLISLPGATHKYFYVWDMSWVHSPVLYGPLGRIIRSTDIFRNINVIARCQEHAYLISNNYNVTPVGVFDNFDYQALLATMGERYQC
jgi:hypothetical protein